MNKTNPAPGGEDALDPITFEVLRSFFEYTCARMSKMLELTAFSPVLVDMVDFSNAIYDADLNLVSQAANCPVHLASMHFSARASVDQFGLDNIAPGDVIVMNDPYQGGTHIPDVAFTTPIFVADELLGFAVNRAHWTDLGGGAAGGYGFGAHIAGEGLRLPPVKLFRRGEIDDQLRRLLLANSRTPQYIEGDIMGHMAALRAGAQELTQAAERYGLATVRRAMARTIDYTERLTKKAIGEIPDGSYAAQDYVDTDGFSETPIRIRVKITIAGEKLSVDFTGTDGMAEGGCNSPYANTYSAVYYSLKFYLSPEAPANAGMYAPIDIVLPEGCFLNATWPAPTIACTTLTSSKITSVIWQALAQALPERVAAPTFAEANAFILSTTHPETGDTHVFADLPAGGWGGTPEGDGMSATMDPLGNCLNLPAEVAELQHPVIYEAFELNPDTGGAGRMRGGLGTRFRVRFLGAADVSVESSRTREGSPGVNGGARSPAQTLYKVGAAGGRDVIGGFAADGSWQKCVFGAKPFAPGEAYEISATGGGGWGDPLERPAARVLEDVRNGYVSPGAAAELYGVVIDERRMSIDEAATKRRRATRGKEEGETVR